MERIQHAPYLQESSSRSILSPRLTAVRQGGDRQDANLLKTIMSKRKAKKIENRTPKTNSHETGTTRSTTQTLQPRHVDTLTTLLSNFWQVSRRRLHAFALRCVALSVSSLTHPHQSDVHHVLSSAKSSYGKVENMKPLNWYLNNAHFCKGTFSIYP